MIIDLFKLPISLCKKKKCCARLSWSKEYKEYIIEDDHRGVVRLTKDELKCLETLLSPASDD